MTRKEFINDVFVTALEGGINYWAAVDVYRPSRTMAIIRDTDRDNAPYTINAAVIRRGINLIVHDNINICDDIAKAVVWGNARNDAGDIDAVVADCIIQAGLFDEVIYG
jgi:hypothetical protein